MWFASNHITLVLPCVAVCFSLFRSVFQCVIMCCNLLQYVATNHDAVVFCTHTFFVDNKYTQNDTYVCLFLRLCQFLVCICVCICVFLCVCVCVRVNVCVLCLCLCRCLCRCRCPCPCHCQCNCLYVSMCTLTWAQSVSHTRAWQDAIVKLESEVDAVSWLVAVHCNKL